jgi:endonuclease/exonuclease/phosphatase family metal-dependent hydrolase
MGSRARVCSLAAAVTFLAVLSPATASARISKPAPPTGIHVTKVTPSSFTVAMHAAAHAKQYRVYVATRSSQLASGDLRHDKSATSKRPSVTVTGLRYQLAPYFYRVETINGSGRELSTTPGTISLRPRPPAKLRSVSTSAKTYLTWNSGAVTGSQIEQATNRGMTSHRHIYSIRGTTHQFTPFGLSRGTTYYYRVRGMNDRTSSVYSHKVTAVSRAKEQPVSVMTYNVLEATDDGRSEGGNRVAPWSQRRIVAAKLIKQGSPDAVGVQEAAAWIGKPGKIRQIDSLRAALGGEYALARTEIPPNKPHFSRTGVYILYKKSGYASVGKGGHWNIGQTRWAAYQVLKNRATGAKFLFVTAHVWDPGGSTGDRYRDEETKKLLKDGRSLAAKRHVPVVYSGDFNSEQGRSHPLDGPGVVMRAANVADSWNAAQHRTWALYDTADTYERRPPKADSRIDYIWAPPGVAVQSWGLVLDLRHGEFVGTIASDHIPVISHLVISYS